MSVITESESHSTLTTAVSMIDIQSDTMDNKVESTPYPSEKISDETLNLLVAASNKLAQDPPKEQRPKSGKRPRRDLTPDAGTSKGPERSSYPAESKPVYLRLKTNHKKKIAIASQISRMHGELLKKVYPPSVDFKFNINQSRSDKVQASWKVILDECKQKLTKTLLDELFTKYSQVKDHIAKDYQSLGNILTAVQLQKIRESLQTTCSRIAATYSKKAKRQYEPRQAPKGQPPKRRKITPNKGKGNTQAELQKFMVQLKKMLKA